MDCSSLATFLCAVVALVVPFIMKFIDFWSRRRLLQKDIEFLITDTQELLTQYSKHQSNSFLINEVITTTMQLSVKLRELATIYFDRKYIYFEKEINKILSCRVYDEKGILYMFEKEFEQLNKTLEKIIDIKNRSNQMKAKSFHRIATILSFLASFFLCSFGRVIATKDLTTATTDNLGGILKLISEHPFGLGCTLIVLGAIGMSMSLFALVKAYEVSLNDRK